MSSSLTIPPQRKEPTVIKQLSLFDYQSASVSEILAGMEQLYKQLTISYGYPSLPARVLRDASSQIPMFAEMQDIEVKQRKAQRKKVNQILEKMEKLHEELNSAFSYRSDAPSIHSPIDAAELVKYDMSALEHEELRVILLNTRNKVLEIVTIYRGSVNQSQVRIAEVFRPAIVENAPAFILIHNHPSGDVSPSPDDVAITKAIVNAGKLLDIDVLDHLVVGGGTYVSLKERGLGF
jgi:DNA repair protein RadC